jgi:predicted aldo/keto reductase-like oxidoreductase
MRMPTLGSKKDIDYPEATRMLRYAVDNGVNYVDTGYPYHEGASETFLGEALKDGYREKVKLATKLLLRVIENKEGVERQFAEQLQKLQTDYLDMYLIHGLNKERWATAKEWDVLEWAEGKKKEGKIRHLGFSFHDVYETFEAILNEYDGWEFVQIQYNYMNEEFQAGTKGLELAASRGIPVIVMEPILGGSLADPPDSIRKIMDSGDTKRTPADWALQWLWSKPEVTTILSGMSTMEQVEQNLASADESAVGLLSEKEIALIEEVKETFDKIRPIPCTSCGYCMPCPSGVDIPRNLNVYNAGHIYNAMERQKGRYQQIPEEARASSCTDCKECEEKCPQDIKVSEWMPKIVSAFAD